MIPFPHSALRSAEEAGKALQEYQNTHTDAYNPKPTSLTEQPTYIQTSWYLDQFFSPFSQGKPHLWAQITEDNPTIARIVDTIAAHAHTLDPDMAHLVRMTLRNMETKKSSTAISFLWLYASRTNKARSFHHAVVARWPKNLSPDSLTTPTTYTRSEVPPNEEPPFYPMIRLSTQNLSEKHTIPFPPYTDTHALSEIILWELWIVGAPLSILETCAETLAEAEPANILTLLKTYISVDVTAEEGAATLHTDLENALAIDRLPFPSLIIAPPQASDLWAQYALKTYMAVDGREKGEAVTTTDWIQSALRMDPDMLIIPEISVTEESLDAIRSTLSVGRSIMILGLNTNVDALIDWANISQIPVLGTATKVFSMS